MRRSRWWFGLSVAFGALAGTSGALGQAVMPFVQPAKPLVEAELLPDRTAIWPGGSVEVGLRLKIEPEWHVYWRNSGDSGMPPAVNWKLPPGFRVEPLRYPAPRRHVDPGDLHTFILEGEPVLLTTLHAPADLKPGEPVAIAADASWLVCKTVCKLGEKSLSLKLATVASAGQAKPENEQSLKHAREELPLPSDKAKHLRKLTAVASVDKVRPGDSFDVGVVVQVADDHHINAHKPLDEFLVPTDVFHDAVEGLSFERPVFPTPIVEEWLAPGEKAAVYRGMIVIRMPVQAEKGLEGQQVRISGVITYQACNDKNKQCYPPMAAEWEVLVPVAEAGAAVASMNEAVFKQAAIATTAPAGPNGGGGNAGSGEAGSDGVQIVVRPVREAGRSWLQRTQDWLQSLGLAGYLVMAFAGGFILNLMPCVLPVISIKVLSFVQQAKENRLRIFTLGTAFAAGIVLSFLTLGVLIVGLGQQWGGLFQMPQVVIGLTAVVTAFSLSLFGVFALFPPRFVNELGERVQQEGHAGAFGMGLLATLLGTACTAPFLSVAIAIASQQPWAIGMLIFLVAGVGMAFPYVLLAAKPAWIRAVPKPGPWMKEFEQVMGFALLATVLWLLNTVVAQLGGEGLLWTLVFLLLVSMGVWLRGRVDFADPPARKIAHNAAMVLLVIFGWWFCFRQMTTIPGLIAEQKSIRLALSGEWLRPLDWSGDEIPWIEYTPERAQQATAAGYTVFVDYTAEWCAICKTNEKAVLNTPAVREVMQRLGVLPFKADFTLRDPVIKADLDKYGRSGVPMYIVRPANQPDEAIVLDELLTTASVTAALEQAGPSQAAALAVRR